MSDDYLSFRPLEMQDMPVLHQWLNQPHMKVHYQSTPMILDEVITKYSERLKPNTPTHCHIAMLRNIPIGKYQCYRICDYKDFSDEIGINHGIAIDLFIGNSAYLHKGLGSKLLQKYIPEIIKKIFPNEKFCFIYHSKKILQQ